MGFFSELKNDLAAAVVPDDVDEKKVTPSTEHEGKKVDLNSLLNNLDNIKLDTSSNEDEEMIKAEDADHNQKKVIAPEELKDEMKASKEDQNQAMLDQMLKSANDNGKDTGSYDEQSEYLDGDEEFIGRDNSDDEDMGISDEIASITKGMIINGDIESIGSLDLMGSIVGNIAVKGKLNITGNVEGNSTAAEVFADSAKVSGDMKAAGAIKVGRGTVIIGNLFASSAVIAGAVKGNIDVNGPVILDSTAIVMGNIKSESVQINNGAVIQGMCSQEYAKVNPTAFFDNLKDNIK